MRKVQKSTHKNHLQCKDAVWHRDKEQRLQPGYLSSDPTGPVTLGKSRALSVSLPICSVGTIRPFSELLRELSLSPEGF